MARAWSVDDWRLLVESLEYFDPTRPFSMGLALGSDPKTIDERLLDVAVRSC